MRTKNVPDQTDKSKASGRIKPDFLPTAISMAILTGMFLAIQKYFFRAKD